jgi:hypothetical protein
MMKQGNEKIGLALRERCCVIGIATGLLLVLALLAWLAITYAAPATILDQIPEYFRAGKIRGGLGLCVTLLFYVVGLPLGLMLSLLGLFQGAWGQRTALTRWLLRELNSPEVREGNERTNNSLVAHANLTSTEYVLNRFLSKAVGWAILLAAITITVAVLVWAANRE